MAIKLHSLFGNICLDEPLPASANPEDDMAITLLEAAALREGLEKLKVSNALNSDFDNAPSEDNTLENNNNYTPKGPGGL